MSMPFISEVRMLPYSFAPRGWTDCTGQVLSISENSALFSLIGTTYGGDGRITTAVPNLTGRAPSYWGTGPGLKPRYYGEFGGEAMVQLSISEMPQHSHSMTGAFGGGTDETDVASNDVYIGPSRGQLSYKKNANASQFVKMSVQTLAVKGANERHENRQPYLAMRFCINLDGLYPPRN